MMEELNAKTLDEDLAALLSLGLQLSDVERLWKDNKDVEMAHLYDAAARQLGGKGLGIPVKRQVTVGLEIASNAPSRADVLPELADMMRYIEPELSPRPPTQTSPQPYPDRALGLY